MIDAAVSFGDLLREWRGRRRLSQLDLAVEAEISQRHLSFVESGRAKPSREMVLRLAEHLAIPLRERNALFMVAGYAPLYRQGNLDRKELEPARDAVDLILMGHQPNPALAVDRHWNSVTANNAASHLMSGVAGSLRQPPINVLRLSLHPDGLAPRIANYREWRAHVLARLSQVAENSGDTVILALIEEFKAYPVPASAAPLRPVDQAVLGGIAIPFELSIEAGTLRFLSTTTVFGTALDVSLSELTIESFFPADRETAAMMAKLGG